MTRTRGEIRDDLARLKGERDARAARWGYATAPDMRDGWGLTKYDCGLVIASLGQFLGYKVYGKADWARILLPGQLNPAVDGGEKGIRYPGRLGGREERHGRSDYAWWGGDCCVAVFETDGRPNRRKFHLPATDPVVICRHGSTNNLFKLSAPVLRQNFGYVPRWRA